MSNEEIDNYFDLGVKPRYQQVAAMKQFIKSYKKGIRYFLFKGGTGVGKSFLAKAILNYCKGGILSTPSKLLQAQYERDFSDMIKLVGKANFKCILDGHTKETMDVAPCRRPAVAVCNQENVASGAYSYMKRVCPYYVMLEKVRKARYANTNIHALYTYINTRLLKPKASLIVDECHELEGVFSSFYSVNVSGAQFKFSLKNKTNYFDSELVAKIIKHVQADIDKLEKKPTLEADEYKKLDKLESKIKSLRYVLKNGEDNYAIYNEEVYDRKGKKHLNLIFRPIYIGGIIKKFFDKCQGTICFFSATVDEDEFYASCGISEDEIAYIEMDNDFDNTLAPIVSCFSSFDVGKAKSFNFSVMDSVLPQMVKKIEEIKRKYPNQRILVHTHSNKIEKYMKLHIKIKGDLCIYGSDYDNKIETIKDFTSKKGSILFSYSAYQGVDLPDDACRIIIFTKLPFLNPNDPYIAQRSKYDFVAFDNNYYQWQTAQKIIQGSSRHIRNSKDFGIVYFFDNLSMFRGMTRFTGLFDCQMLDRMRQSDENIKLLENRILNEHLENTI